VLDASEIDHPDRSQTLQAIMPTMTPTILDQISVEKTKISERLHASILIAQRSPLG
jgi:hypothetical protein